MSKEVNKELERKLWELYHGWDMNHFFVCIVKCAMDEIIDFVDGGEYSQEDPVKMQELLRVLRQIRDQRLFTAGQETQNAMEFFFREIAEGSDLQLVAQQTSQTPV